MRTLRRVMRWGLLIVAGGSLLGLLLLGSLQIDGISTWLVGRLADRLNPYPGTQLSVDRVSGSWVQSLRFDGVRLTPLEGRGQAGPEAVLDSLEVHFRFFPLLLRRVEILEAKVMGLRAELTQRPDSLWDFLAPFQGTDEPDERPGGEDRIRFRSGLIRVHGGSARVVFAPEGPSAAPDRLEIEDLSLVVANLEVGEGGLAASLDTVYARFLPPGEVLDRVIVEGKGTVADGRVVTPGLSLRSGASDVSAQGTLLLPRGEEGEVEEIDFRLQANPLAFRDLSGFIRSLDPTVSAEADLRLQGRASLVDLSGWGTLSDGGRLDLEGTFTPSASGPVEYRLEGTSEALRLESMLGRGPVGGVVDGRFWAELEGSDLTHLQGDLDARVEGLQLDGRGARPLVVSGSFLDGQADLKVNAGVDGLGALEFSVGGRPLDPKPTLQVHGTYRNNGPQADTPPNLSERPPIRELESRFAFEARGFSVDSATAELEVRTLHGTYRGLTLEGGILKALWRGGEGSFELSQPIGKGLLATTGEVSWGRDPAAFAGRGRVLRYSVPDLELRELDLSGLLGDTLPGRVNAGVTLEGMGTDLGTLDAEIMVRLQESEFRGIALDSAVARPSLKGGALSVLVEGWPSRPEEEGRIPAENAAPQEASEGRVAASFRGRPFDAEPFLILDSLEFSGIDLATIAGTPSHLNGLARGRMEGLDPRTGHVRGELQFFPSRIRSTLVDSAVVVAFLSEGDLQLSGHFSSSDGTLGLKGGSSPFADPLEFHVDEGEVRGLNLGAFLGQVGLESELNLDLDLHGSGASLQDLEALGNLVFLPSTINQGTIRGGSLALEATGGHGAIEGGIRTRGGEVTLRGHASMERALEEVVVEGDVNVSDLGEFLDRTQAALMARGEMAVTWTTQAGLAFASNLEGRIGEASIDTLTVSGSLRNSVLQLDTLRVSSDLLRAYGGGSLAFGENHENAGEWDLSVTADLLDVSTLAPLVGLEELSAQSGRGELQLTGPAGAPSLAASLNLGPWLLNGVSGDSARIRADRNPDGITLATWIQTPKERGFVDLVLRADPRPDEKRGTLERLNVSTPETLWALEAQVPFSWKNGVQIDNLALASDQGRISVDGRIDRHGTQDLTLRLEEAPLFGVARLLGLESLDLLAHGQIALTGAADSPEAEGNLSLKVALPEGGSVSTDTRFSLADGRLALDVQALDSAGGPLTLEGTVPWGFSLAPEGDTASSVTEGAPGSPLPKENAVDLTLRSQAFDISWIEALVPPGTIADMAGRLSVDARASGPADQPVLDGRISVEEGQVHISELGTTYEEITFSADLREQEVWVEQARFNSGPGTAEIQGVISFEGLRPREMDLTARTDRFLAVSSPSVDATLSGDLHLRGSVQEPQLGGNLNLEGSKIWLDALSLGSDVRAVELTDEDYRMLEDYFGYRIEEGDEEPSGFVERLALDLVVTSDQDVWINRSGKLRVALEVRGNLELKKDPMGDYQAIGTVETLSERSYFRQFGRRFAVQEGELVLTGDPSEFVLHMDAQWEVPSHSNPDEAEVLVNLGVDGDAESLELTLSSEPDMDEADIVSYLATGQPQSTLASSDADAASLGASMAMGVMAGFLEGLAMRAVELDVVEVQVDPVQGTTLIAGRYVSPKLYLGFRQPVTFSESSDRTRTQNQESEVELEYRWFRWLTMNARGGASELGLFLRARYAH